MNSIFISFEILLFLVNFPTYAYALPTYRDGAWGKDGRETANSKLDYYAEVICSSSKVVDRKDRLVLINDFMKTETYNNSYIISTLVMLAAYDKKCPEKFNENPRNWVNR